MINHVLSQHTLIFSTGTMIVMTANQVAIELHFTLANYYQSSHLLIHITNPVWGPLSLHHASWLRGEGLFCTSFHS